MRASNFWLLALLAAAFNFSPLADIVNLANGDRFIGSIELVNAAEVQLKSETLGLAKIARAKVQSIYFGTNQPPARVASAEKPGKDTAASLFDQKHIDKVQEEFLATAGAEANAMFKNMIQGLASGKITVDDLRKQACDSLKELKELQADLGDNDDTAILSTYAGILERFINQGSTNRAKATVPKPEPNATKPDGDE
jgi:hypothetical protein